MIGMMLYCIIDWLVIVGYDLSNMFYMYVKFGGYPRMFDLFRKCPKFLAAKLGKFSGFHRLATCRQPIPFPHDAFANTIK